MKFAVIPTTFAHPSVTQKTTASTVVLLLSLWMSFPAQAQIGSDASRLGSFAGAMRYCEEHADGSERRYRYARLRVAKVIDGMDREEKRRARFARDRAHRGGTFLSKRLDSHQCQSLLELSEWRKYMER